MSYKIIADSCCEFPEEYKEDPRFVNIPLGLDVAGEHLWDPSLGFSTIFF